MPPKKPAIVIDGIDIEEFKRQKVLVEQKANAAVSEKILEIRKLLGEINELGRVTGVPVRLNELIYDMQEMREYLDPAWNSSSAYC
jgi:hypothetical protein